MGRVNARWAVAYARGGAERHRFYFGLDETLEEISRKRSISMQQIITVGRAERRFLDGTPREKTEKRS
jgi:hypothetical protein